MIVSLIHLIENFETAVTFSVVDRFWIRVAHDVRREILFDFGVSALIHSSGFRENCKKHFLRSSKLDLRFSLSPVVGLS